MKTSATTGNEKLKKLNYLFYRSSSKPYSITFETPNINYEIIAQSKDQYINAKNMQWKRKYSMKNESEEQQEHIIFKTIFNVQRHFKWWLMKSTNLRNR